MLQRRIFILILSCLVWGACGSEDEPHDVLPGALQPTLERVKRALSATTDCRLSIFPVPSPVPSEPIGISDQAGLEVFVEENRAAGELPFSILHLTGLAALAMGDPDLAAGILSRSPGGSPSQAAGDLACSLIVKANRTQLLEDWLAAFEPLDRGLQSSPTDPLLLYNLATLLQALHLYRAAELSWAEFLAHEPDPAWSKKGAAMLAVTRRTNPDRKWEESKRLLDPTRTNTTLNSTALQEITNQFGEALNEWVEDELFPLWARAALEGDRIGQDSILSRLQQILQDAQPEDRFPILGGSLQAIRRLQQNPSPPGVTSLARSHLRFGLGRAAFRDENYRRALQDFEQASAGFRAVESPFELVSAYFEALCLYHLERRREAGSRVDLLIRRISGSDPSSHEERLRSFRSLLLAFEGRASDSREETLRALDLARRLGDFEALAKLTNDLSSFYLQTGQPERGARSLLDAMARLGQITNRRYRYLLTSALAAFALERQFIAAARRVQVETVVQARLYGQPTALARSLLLQARLQLETPGGIRPSRQSLEEARAVLETIPDALRGSLRADLDMHEAALLGREGSGDALALLARAEDQHRDLLPRLGEVYRLRGDILLAKGESEAALAGFLRALDIIELQEEQIRQSATRGTFLARWTELLDLAVELQSRQAGGSIPSLLLAERSSARVFLGGSPVQTAVSRANWMEMSKHLSVLRYYQLRDELLIWLIQDGEVTLERIDCPSGWLRKQVQDLRSLRHGGGLETARQLQSLWQVLIGPVSRSLDSHRPLLVVPDKEVWLVPMAALRAPESNRYLIEDHEIRISPGLSSIDPAKDLRERDDPLSALVIGNPTPDRLQGDWMDPLAGAEEEAGGVAAVYPRHSLLLRREATETRLRSELGRYEILHFAGHGVNDPVDPFSSRLILANDNRQDGDLTVLELMEMDLRHLELVVLSGCETGAWGAFSVQVPASLANAFLAAGAPSVVASLWPVSDRASVLFMERLHRNFRQSRSISRALRETQLSYIAGEGGPASDWAAFLLFGL